MALLHRMAEAAYKLSDASLMERQEFALPPGNPNDGVARNRRAIIASSAFMIFLAVTSTVARLFFRRSSKLSLKWDDYFIVLGCIIAVANAGCFLAALRYGFGKHIYVIPVTDLLSFFKLVFATFHLYGGALTMVKMSVLCLYHRIFPRSFPKMLLALGMISVIWWVSFIFITTFQCLPTQKIWDARVEGACLNYLSIYIALQSWNILLDMVILCLPISAVMGLQMSLGNKISVAGTFALGFLSVIFAIIRLTVLVNDRHQTDITFAIATALWSLIEPAFQIFVASLPTFTPLLKAGRSFSKWSSSQGSSFRGLFGSNRSGSGATRSKETANSNNSSDEHLRNYSSMDQQQYNKRNASVSVSSDRAARRGDYVV